MMDFIYKLYSYDNFTLYLTICLIVLVILFILVFIFGKKDQKLEETKRLQKIELEKTKELEIKKETDTFKEESLGEKIEISQTPTEIVAEQPIVEEKKEDTPNPILPNEETMLIPNISQMALEDLDENKVLEPLNETNEVIEPPTVVESIAPLISEEEKSVDVMTDIIKNMEENPGVEQDEQKEVTLTIFEPTAKEVESLDEAVIPPKVTKRMDTEEEQMPISVEDIASFKFDELDKEIESDLTTLESIKKEFNNIELPEISLPAQEELPESKPEVEKEEIEKYERTEWPPKDDKKPFAPSQVFSSVFVAKEEGIPTEEKPVEMPKINADDEDEFELPELKAVDEIPLKKEVVKEEPVKKEGVFSFDDLVN